jgi:pimeloyl-ACP methyl ester carboxylesterase
MANFIHRGTGLFHAAVTLITTSALLSLLTACGVWRPVTVPLRTIDEPARCGTSPDTLLVMLPGSYSLPEEFQREGFVDAVRTRRIAADITLVDAHTGYYADHSIVDRLKADVIDPALAKRYRHVWLVGISIGAFGALIYTVQQPLGIDGVVLLGPYLGKRQLTQEITAQGGLANWRAPVGKLEPDDVDDAVWRWLQQHPSANSPELFFGFGRQDRFIFDDKVLAAALPGNRVFPADGGHDWPAWRDSWQRMLDTMPLKRDASCSAAAR